MRSFKKLFICLFLIFMTFAVSLNAAAAETDKLLAFPGAEGGGKYSPGARGVLSDGGIRVRIK